MLKWNCCHQLIAVRIVPLAHDLAEQLYVVVCSSTYHCSTSVTCVALPDDSQDTMHRILCNAGVQ